MKFNLRKFIYVMLFAVAVLGAIMIYRGVGKVGKSLSHYEWYTFGIACACAFGNYCLRFLKWEYYLATLGVRGVKKLDSFLTFLSGFVLTVTPGKVGEVFKSWVLSQTHGVPMAQTAPIVIADRVTDVIGIAILIAIGSAGFKGGLMWAAIGIGLVLVLLAVIGSARLSNAIIDIVARLPGRIGGIAPKLRTSYASLALLVQLKHLVLPSMLSVVAWFLECLSMWIILGGFGERTSVVLCMFFYSTSTLAGALIPVPGGVGVVESTLMEQLIQLGHVEEGNATAAMALTRFATLWFAVLVGFIAFGILKRKHPELLKSEST